MFALSAPRSVSHEASTSSLRIRRTCPAVLSCCTSRFQPHRLSLLPMLYNPPVPGHCRMANSVRLANFPLPVARSSSRPTRPDRNTEPSGANRAERSEIACRRQPEGQHRRVLANRLPTAARRARAEARVNTEHEQHLPKTPFVWPTSPFPTTRSSHGPFPPRSEHATRNTSKPLPNLVRLATTSHPRTEPFVFFRTFYGETGTSPTSALPALASYQFRPERHLTRTLLPTPHSLLRAPCPALLPPTPAAGRTHVSAVLF
jgi:hypothetical protein